MGQKRVELGVFQHYHTRLMAISQLSEERS